MSIRALVLCLVALGAAGLAAQATAPINGTLAAGEERFHAFTIDFGSTPAAHTITVAISGNSATAGLDVFLGNLDEIAAAGFATGGDSDFNAGTGTINLSVTTPAYSGTHTFIVNASENTPGTGVTYTGTINCATLGTGAITAGATHLRTATPPPIDVIFNRIVLMVGTATMGEVERHDVLVNFGGTAQTATLFAQCNGSATGSATVQEILATGAASTLGAALSGAGSWSAEGNRTTSSRSGDVRLRMVVQRTGGTDMDFDAAMVLPATVSAYPLTQITVTGTLAASERRIHRITIDFGATAVDQVLQLLALTETGGPNTAVVDRSEVTTNGSATGIAPGVPWTLPTHSGSHDILVVVEEDDGGSDTYTYTLGMAVLPGAITTATQLSSRDDPMVVQFDIGVQGVGLAPSGGSRTVEVLVDFGTVAHTATFFAQANGDVAGSVTVSEMLANGTASVLGTLSSASASWNDEANLTTSSRSGVVRLRLTAAGTATAMDFSYSLFFAEDVSVPAQTTISFTGSLAIGQERFHRIGLNYGANATTLGFTLINATVTSNVGFTMVDVNELATNGPALGFFGNPEVLTASHTGAQEFVFVFSEDSGTMAATYDVELQVALPAASITNLGTQVLAGTESYSLLFNIAAEGSDTLTAAGTVTREFSTDFGATTHTASVWLRGSGNVTGNVELFDITSGTPVSLGTVSWTGTAEDDANILISARTGVIRMRVVITGSAAGSFDWSAVFDRSVNVFIPGGGGGDDDDDDGGCSTGQGSSNWLALLAGLGLLVVALRLRRA